MNLRHVQKTTPHWHSEHEIESQCHIGSLKCSTSSNSSAAPHMVSYATGTGSCLHKLLQRRQDSQAVLLEEGIDDEVRHTLDEGVA